MKNVIKVAMHNKREKSMKIKKKTRIIIKGMFNFLS